MGLGNPYLIAFLIALTVGLGMYAMFVPKNKEGFAFSKNDSESFKSLGYLANEIYNTLPQGMFTRRRPNARVEALIIRSGNPWKLTAYEFNFMKFVCAFIGFVASWPIWWFVSTMQNVPWWAMVAGITLLAYLLPEMHYKDSATKRELEFMRRLPEALDLLIIAIGSGITFQQALREILPNMHPGILQEEFAAMSRKIDAGHSLDTVLDEFAERAPNEGIITFVRSLQESIKVNVPIMNTLQARSEASRAEFFALVHKRIATLESKMMGILTPTLVPAIMITVLAPSMVSLTENMASM